jgi:hypothetical protein
MHEQDLITLTAALLYRDGMGLSRAVERAIELRQAVREAYEREGVSHVVMSTVSAAWPNDEERGLCGLPLEVRENQ